MINSNNTTLLNLKLNSTEKKITNIEDVNCIMSVSYRIKDDKVMLWFQTSCKEGNKVIFEMECEYKCPIEEYDDEKEMIMNLVSNVSPKVEELVALFTSQMLVDA